MVLKQRLFILSLFLFFTSLNLTHSQQTELVSKYYSVMVNYGKTEIHSEFVNNLNGSHPKGINVEIGKHYLTPKAMETFGCYPRFGFTFNYWDFDYTEVGWGLTSAVFFEPFLLLRKNFMWSIRGGAGLAWLSNPYSKTDNPVNLAYSTHINFPLHIGFNFYKPVNQNLALKLSASFQHLSNGAVTHPNYGINYSVISFGIDHSFSGYVIPHKSHTDGLKMPKENRSKRIEAVLGMGPKDVSGTKFLMSYIQGRYFNQWTRINGWTTGIIGEYDLSIKEDFMENSRFSIFLGHEFIFNKVGFSQEFGWYAYSPHKTQKKFFQLYSLHMKVLKNMRAGVCLKAHANVAEYVAGRLAYVFNLN